MRALVGMIDLLLCRSSRHQGDNVLSIDEGFMDGPLQAMDKLPGNSSVL